jgi:hypothetical protein
VVLVVLLDKAIAELVETMLLNEQVAVVVKHLLDLAVAALPMVAAVALGLMELITQAVAVVVLTTQVGALAVLAVVAEVEEMILAKQPLQAQ